MAVVNHAYSTWFPICNCACAMARWVLTSWLMRITKKRWLFRAAKLEERQGADLASLPFPYNKPCNCRPLATAHEGGGIGIMKN
jgi:hypothetical protein